MATQKNKFIPRTYLETGDVNTVEFVLGYVNTKGDFDTTSINLTEEKSITLQNSDIHTPTHERDTLVLAIKTANKDGSKTAKVYNSTTKEIETDKEYSDIVEHLINLGFKKTDNPNKLSLQDKFAKINTKKNLDEITF